MPDHRFQCYLIGSESLLINCAEWLIDNGHGVLGVITDSPSIAAWCATRGTAAIPLHGDYTSRLSEQPFDYLLSITNRHIVPTGALALPRRGAINFHDGPLPRYGGLHAPSWALMAGETEHGITWHSMTDEVDAGSIVLQRRFPISPDETALTLNAKCFEAGVESFPALFAALCDTEAAVTPHQIDTTTYHKRSARPSALGGLDWSKPSVELAARVRALSFGTFANTLGNARIVANGRALLVGKLVGLESTVAPAGTVLRADKDALWIATGEGAIGLGAFATEDGKPLDMGAALEALGARVGDQLPPLDAQLAAALDAYAARAGRYEDEWVTRLLALDPLEMMSEDRATDAPSEPTRVLLTPSRDRDSVAASFAIFMARLSGRSRFDITFTEPNQVDPTGTLGAFVSTTLPLRVDLGDATTVAEAHIAMSRAFEWVRHRVGYPRDLAARQPGLRHMAGAPLSMPVGIALVDHLEDFPVSRAALTLVIARDGTTCWDYDTSRISTARVELMCRQFTAALAADARTEWRAIPMLSPDERRQVLQEWASVAKPAGHGVCIHELFAAQAAKTPDDIALVFEDDQLTYSALDRRANQLANHLHALGAGPETLIAVGCDRSIEMLVGILGVLKAGAAYVPIDPSFPSDRLAFMIEDAQARILLTRESVLGGLPSTRASVVCLDRDWAEIAKQSDRAPFSAVMPSHLAYCIYTSGSTGRPKGVMVEHRNVTNLFAAMDARLGTSPGVWLAITSLSFDISVLELLWTLTRGYKVVLQPDTARLDGVALGHANANKPVDFSLFYFSADENENAADRYRILMEGARFGDEHGFAAIWTPERHFHAFGGLYPNPSVTGAAIAAITKRIGVRAGSCVLPLHHPVRVAEEWAMVDNLSGGRVGVSFAAGWQPNDFILNPDAYADAKSNTIAMIDTVRRLWRGEEVTFRGPRGDVPVRTMPRPVQPELQVWYTTAGSPESYELAGRLGVNVLTHLLGQTIEDLAAKIDLYRKTWRASGHPGEGKVSLMLHTFVGDSDSDVKEIVRGPMKAYLRSSVSLINKGAAEAFPTFKRKSNSPAPTLDFGSLSADEMDALLEYSFERYYETSGLFGTVETCARTVDRLKGVGVDDIACLIDFGVETERVLKHLKQLSRVRALTGRVQKARGDTSLPALVERHQVTHLQCTPTMAAVLCDSTQGREALGRLRTLCVGGEALAAPLAADLQRLVPGDVHNMYGPTETTIWSTMHTLNGETASIPLGRPLPNNELYVLDAFAQPVPPGTAGELFIGGQQVVRGYWRRPELTAERFVPNPFRDDATGRLYRTGDIVRWRADGKLEFLGRTDQQVKIRGHRIELGEIESTLLRHPSVREAVVVARQGPDGALLLVAYVVWRQPVGDGLAVLRTHLRATLPSSMIPSHFVVLPQLPRTPNGKIDRQQLPAVAAPSLPTPARTPMLPAAGAVEQAVAAVWQDVLKIPEVGMLDNFFDLGGHSLLAVQVHSRLKMRGHHDLSITDLFRFPTVRSLAAHLEGAADDGATQRAQAQALRRRESLERRTRLSSR
jgi:natural product biosynthesis luciferase-like monooxygenase protein